MTTPSRPQAERPTIEETKAAMQRICSSIRRPHLREELDAVCLFLASLSPPSPSEQRPGFDYEEFNRLANAAAQPKALSPTPLVEGELLPSIVELHATPWDEWKDDPAAAPSPTPDEAERDWFDINDPLHALGFIRAKTPAPVHDLAQWQEAFATLRAALSRGAGTWSHDLPDRAGKWWRTQLMGQDRWGPAHDVELKMHKGELCQLCGFAGWLPVKKVDRGQSMWMYAEQRPAPPTSPQGQEGAGRC